MLRFIMTLKKENLFYFYFLFMLPRRFCFSVSYVYERKEAWKKKKERRAKKKKPPQGNAKGKMGLLFR